ncbi:ionic transporter y4hA [Saccharothrix longispora]|uniref:calcium:proton antiporter n=1 Tax=Saccharothrix longispora TaxID=33920 RepID=UPI0028FD40F6|nr:ionic transporter y4hA [Saccharothrix longispora]MDU0293214.1 ionic transporter y4hA [Saccharothrix longispora]
MSTGDAGTVTLPKWSIVLPAVGLVALVVSWGRDLNAVLLVLVCVGLGGGVVAAVHHAEVVAHRVGEPFGTLILAVAVTVIEVALIVTLMSSGGDKAATLARDTVFAAVMITCNGIVGLALLAGSLRHRVQRFRSYASGGAFAVTLALVTLSLVLPGFTTSSAGPTFSGSQLAFAGVMSLVLYGVFVFVQTVRHRDYFLPKETATRDDHAAAPSGRTTLTSLGLLLLCLVAVVGLAKAASPALESAVEAVGAPLSLVGVLIALLVLMPETVAAVRAALRDRLQVSMNLALGSAMASIGLTIPAIAIASIWMSGPLVLGLGGKELVLLALTAAVGTLTVVSGRATVLQGAVHLVVFSAFLFLTVTP